MTLRLGSREVLEVMAVAGAYGPPSTGGSEYQGATSLPVHPGADTATRPHSTSVEPDDARESSTRRRPLNFTADPQPVKYQ